MKNNDEESPVVARADIQYPGQHDVMLGRGGESNYHSGNLTFRQFIMNYRDEYRAAPRPKKPDIAMRVVRDWRALDPPGRFLARTHPERADSLWHDVADDVAQKRALKTLGEKGGRPRKGKGQKRPSPGTSSEHSQVEETKISRGAEPAGGSTDSIGNTISNQWMMASVAASPTIPLQLEIAQDATIQVAAGGAQLQQQLPTYQLSLQQVNQLQGQTQQDQLVLQSLLPHQLNAQQRYQGQGQLPSHQLNTHELLQGQAQQQPVPLQEHSTLENRQGREQQQQQLQLQPDASQQHVRQHTAISFSAVASTSNVGESGAAAEPGCQHQEDSANAVDEQGAPGAQPESENGTLQKLLPTAASLSRVFNGSSSGSGGSDGSDAANELQSEVASEHRSELGGSMAGSGSNGTPDPPAR